MNVGDVLLLATFFVFVALPVGFVAVGFLAYDLGLVGQEAPRR